MRGATRTLSRTQQRGPISIHAPRAGSDAASWITSFDPAGFQSTLPVRGATEAAFPLLRITQFQSTLPVRGATARYLGHSAGIRFQSTLPVRGATKQAASGGNCRHISIHAPRAGSDPGADDGRPRGGNFNPRSPCGERQHHRGVDMAEVVISIHAPRAGSDWPPAEGRS